MNFGDKTKATAHIYVKTRKGENHSGEREFHYNSEKITIEARKRGDDLILSMQERIGGKYKRPCASIGRKRERKPRTYYF